MRILFFAMAGSIHTARWIRQLESANWDLHLVSSIGGPPEPSLQGATVYIAPSYRRWRQPGVTIRYLDAEQPRASWSVSLIRRLRPDVIHSMETQQAGYQMADARRALTVSPPWLHSNWGSDIQLFQRVPEHRARIVSMLSYLDYYGSECRRDVALARQLGFHGHAMPVFPCSGGLPFDQLDACRSAVPSSRRRLVMLKGYQHFAGRALVALEAIRRCQESMRSFRLVIYSATPDVALAAQILSTDTGIEVELVEHCAWHDNLRLHGQARVSVGLSVSDGLSTSVLEAASLGSFPVQSHTSCCGELLEDGKQVLLVPPEDPSAVAAALQRALTDDDLVDEAARLNREMLERRWGWEVIRPLVVENYHRIAAWQSPLQLDNGS